MAFAPNKAKPPTLKPSNLNLLPPPSSPANFFVGSHDGHHHLSTPTPSPSPYHHHHHHLPRSPSHRSLTGSHHTHHTQYLDLSVIRQWQQYGLRPPVTPVYSPSSPTATSAAVPKSSKTPITTTTKFTFETVGEHLEPQKFSRTTFSRSLRWKRAAYNFIRRPSGFWSYAYHTTVAVVVLLGVLFYSLSTVPGTFQELFRTSFSETPFSPSPSSSDLEWWAMIVLHVLDITIVSLLTLEFIVLVWAATCVSRFRGWAGLGRFLLTPFRLIDLLGIAISGFIIWTHWFSTTGHHRDIVWLRCGQLFQVLRLETRFKSWRLLRTVFWLERKHLLAVALLCFFVLVFLSYSMYFIEQAGDPETTKFTNIPVSLYWGVVTCFAIGYGDFAPTTTAGRAVEGFLVTFACVIWVLPAEILATGLALKVQENRHLKQLKRRKAPAARLIQFAWRRYATSAESEARGGARSGGHLVATWQYRKATSAAARLRPDPHLTMYGRSPLQQQQQQQSPLAEKQMKSTSSQTFHEIPLEKQSHHQSQQQQIPLSRAQRNAIRFIVALRFAVARRHFASALSPYDIQDVVAQYGAEHEDVVERVRFMQYGIETANEKAWTELVGRMQASYKARADRIDRLQEVVERMLRMVEDEEEERGESGDGGDDHWPPPPPPPPPKTPTFKVEFFPTEDFDGGGDDQEEEVDDGFQEMNEINDSGSQASIFVFPEVVMPPPTVQETQF